MVVRSKNKKSKQSAKNREKLERMAREQGVEPFRELETKYNGNEFWETDEEFEAFLKHLQTIRQEKN